MGSIFAYQTRQRLLYIYITDTQHKCSVSWFFKSSSCVHVQNLDWNYCINFRILFANGKPFSNKGIALLRINKSTLNIINRRNKSLKFMPFFPGNSSCNYGNDFIPIECTKNRKFLQKTTFYHSSMKKEK